MSIMSIQHTQMLSESSDATPGYKRMDDLEGSVKSQFARVFSTSDWRLFKKMAEVYLLEAAFLKKSAFNVPKNFRLLVRNSRKRLFIGIGVELLLKSIYLKTGYCINKPQDKKAPLKLPFKIAAAPRIRLRAADTYTLDNLIAHLDKVVRLQKPKVTSKGLHIAKVFRNKEGHVVTRAHRFDPSSYRAIESALVDVYASAFREQLKVHFSFARKEKGAWHVRPLDNSSKDQNP